MTISGHFWPSLAIFIFIFHKTEVHTIILRCSTGLNLDWSKSYGLRCSVNSPKIATDNWPFYDHVWSFFANYMFIFQKTDIQMMVISRILKK